jgi:hypothetical protein
LSNERRDRVSSSNIRVEAVPRPDGLDVERLALVLLEIVDRLPARRLRELAAQGEALLARAEEGVRSQGDAGSAA